MEKLKGFDVYEEVPDGWEVFPHGASLAPEGHVFIICRAEKRRGLATLEAAKRWKDRIT